MEPAARLDWAAGFFFPQNAMRHLTASDFRVHAVRLRPGDDLREELEKLTALAPLRAGVVLSAVGSLTQLALRFADRKEETVRTGKFEVVSLTGTLGPDGCHLHLAVSDGDGVTAGGHLLPGCLVYTTMELVVGDAVGLIFHRELDSVTGFRELSIQKST
jgi:predicted DNA-binding protein with PD1-like motif